MKDTSYIKGISTVNFEAIAKNRFFSAIKRSNLTDMKLLRNAYIELKNRIGHVPQLQDFIQHNSIDPLVIVQKYQNYYRFLLKLKESDPVLSAYEDQVIMMLSLEILNCKRKHEILLLDLLMKQPVVSLEEYQNCLQENNCYIDNETLASVKRILDLSFYNISSQKKYGEKPLVITDEEGNFKLHEQLLNRLQSNSIFKEMVMDLIASALELSKQYTCEQPLTLHKKYTRKDACRLLNWHNDESSTMYGYKTKHGTCPIFVTYHKNHEVESSVAYNEEFINQEIFKWSTRSNRTLLSPEVQTIINAEQNDIDLHLFIKKDNDEGGDFYYLGEATPDQNAVEQSTMQDKNDKTIPVVHMNLVLENSVESKLFYYIGSEE